MASGTQLQNIDDLMACVAGMGFDVDDCRDAVQAGKLTVEAAVEWILAGKPSVEVSPTNTRLRLGQTSSVPIGSNPFSDPKPPPEGDSPAAYVSPLDDPPGEPILQSRLHGTEEQRRDKERFEEQQRNVAKKKAIAEKKAQKEEHTRILAQIKEDREVQRLRMSSGGSRAPPGGVVGHAPRATDSAETVAKHDECLLQIRLPDGRALKKTFPPDAMLGEVWAFVKEKCNNHDGMCLMQPFPHQEFGETHMTSTLKDLQLVPTGSLVLKKVQTPQVTDTAMSGVSEEPPPPTPSEPPHPHPHPPQAPSHPHHMHSGAMSSPETSHKWGSGHTLMDEGESSEQNRGEGNNPLHEHEELPEDEDDMDVEEEGEDEEAVPMGAHLPPQDWDHFPGMHFPENHHLWGEGQRLIGVVWDDDNLPHHRQNPNQLAAEAARQRYARGPPAEQAQEGTHVVLAPQQAVTPLLQTVMRHVSGRICDTRHPIVGLQGLPAQLASRVLEHLVKERLLCPRTLQTFISCHLHSINLDSYPYNTNELLAALRHHTNLVSLSLCNSPLITDKGLQPLAGLKRLRSLNLGGCRQLTNNCLTLVTELPALTTLCLADVGVTNDGVIASIPRCTQLQRLDLNRTQVNQLIFPALQALPNLKCLGLEQTKVSHRGQTGRTILSEVMLTSLEGVQCLSTLEVLSVCGTQVDTASISCLSRINSLIALNIAISQNIDGDTALKQLSGLRLQSLQLPSRLSTTDHGMSFITAMPLHTLDLTNYINIGDAGIEHVGHIHSLQRLILSNTKVTDVGMAALTALKNLQELVLNRTAVTDTGAAYIGALTNLKDLSLSQTCISNQFLKSGALNKCIFLAKLNLCKTNISDKGVTRLRLPNLTLLNVDGTRVRSATVEMLPGCPRLQKVYWEQLLNPEDSDDSS